MVEAEKNQGVIIRAIGGFYDVFLEDGEVVRCTLRGKNKNNEEAVIPGDFAIISKCSGCDGTVEELLPRKNSLFRPLVANVSQLIAVISARSPRPQWNSLNRQLVSAEMQNINAIVCLNKIDLAKKEELEELIEILSFFPYKKVLTSANSEEGLSALRKFLKGNISVFSGPSGVGKSSLINVLNPGLALKTGEVSSKIGRGRHTTRHVELFFLEEDGGMVVDTPGFSRMDIAPGDMDFPDHYYPEIKELRTECRFRNCMHKNEPGCAVRKAVEDEKVSSMRYEHYLDVIKEMEL